MSLINDALAQARRQRSEHGAHHEPAIESAMSSTVGRETLRSPFRVIATVSTLLAVGAGIAFGARARIVPPRGMTHPAIPAAPVGDTTSPSSAPIVVLQATPATEVVAPQQDSTTSTATTIDTSLDTTPVSIAGLKKPVLKVVIPKLTMDLTSSPVATATATADRRSATETAAPTTDSSTGLSADSLFKLAYAQQTRNDLDGAQALYERAVATRHASAEVYNDYGVLLLARGNRTLATEMFRQALNRDDRSVEAWVNLGDCFRAAGRQVEAVSAYVRANRIDPFRPAVRARIARLFAELGDTTAARRYQPEIQKLLDSITRVP